MERARSHTKSKLVSSKTTFLHEIIYEMTPKLYNKLNSILDTDDIAGYKQSLKFVETEREREDSELSRTGSLIEAGSTLFGRYTSA